MQKNSESAKSENCGRLDTAPVSGQHRLLIIRFSSFGDIVQAMGVPADFLSTFPGAKVDWLVREDFKGLLEQHPQISKVIPFPRKNGLLGLLKLAWQLAGQDYSHVYDAHNNVRSHLVYAAFRLRKGCSFFFKRRSKQRIRRWLFFRLGIRSVLPQPFRGAQSFHEPLAGWGFKGTVPPGQHFYPKSQLPKEIVSKIASLPRPLVVAAPSAAWAMKRWPLAHWKTLIQELNNRVSFVFLGGPEDTFISDLTDSFPTRSLNLAGQLSLAQSCAVLEYADLVIANDTGVLHVADQMERPAIALIGPTAFGYPSHATSKTLEIELPCKPCTKDGRGGCRNSLYQRCLVELSPVLVAKSVRHILHLPES
jgi:heptosyltransferase-2